VEFLLIIFWVDHKADRPRSRDRVRNHCPNGHQNLPDRVALIVKKFRPQQHGPISLDASKLNRKSGLCTTISVVGRTPPFCQLVLPNGNYQALLISPMGWAELGRIATKGMGRPRYTRTPRFGALFIQTPIDHLYNL
jgi:hypothetical protein